MRKFWLTSQRSTDFHLDLMEKDAFASSPSGLGVTINTELYRFGTDTLTVNETVEYKNIEYDMIFGYESEDPYLAFENFVKKLKIGKFILHYSPRDGVEYHRTVKFNSIDKGEIENSYNYLKAGISFTPLTPWYTWERMTNYSGSKMTLNTENSMLLSENRTLPVKIEFNLKEYSNEIKIQVFKKGDTTPIFTSHFNKAFISGSKLEYNSDYMDLKASCAGTDLFRFITTGSNSIARCPCDGEEYEITVNGQAIDENDSFYVRQEVVVV